jgi:hypothetical protein
MLLLEQAASVIQNEINQELLQEQRELRETGGHRLTA